MTFNIIERKKNLLGNISNSQWFLIILFSSFFVILKFINNQYFDFFGFYVISGLVGFIIFRFVDYEQLNSKFLGLLKIEDDYVQIKSQKYYLSDIHILHFSLKNYQGENRDIISYNMYFPQYFIGKGNFFKLITKSNEKVCGEFQILSHLDFIKLKLFY